jgi:hypothetical protein
MAKMALPWSRTATLISTGKVGWDNWSLMNTSPQSPVNVVLEVFPGSQQALFPRGYIGGCELSLIRDEHTP